MEMDKSTNVKFTIVSLELKMNGELKYAQIMVWLTVNVNSMFHLAQMLGIVKMLKSLLLITILPWIPMVMVKST